MPRDRDRERLVREGVAQARQMMADPSRRIEDDGIRFESLAEILAVLAAEARAAGADEGLAVEILLRALDHDRETLLEAHAIMAALGYAEIAAILKRLARSAPPRLTWRERMKASRERHAPGC